MNILVLGGSYFLGRYFVNLTCRSHTLYVFNRGNQPLNISGVTEIKGDRHVQEDLSALTSYEIDAVVDFCAYQKQDIASVCSILGGTLKQYVFVSTVDVYVHGSGRELDEAGPLEQRHFAGPEGEYISGKVALEAELVEEAQKYGFHYTVLRPAFIYGPGNYAPREGLYFNWIRQAGQILHPVDATGEFQLVYVLDVARAAAAALGNAKAYDEAFNLTGEEVESYDSFYEILRRVVDMAFERVDISIETVYERNIPLPFPLTKEESNRYNGKKALALIGTYTSFEEGMKNTAQSVI